MHAGLIAATLVLFAASATAQASTTISPSMPPAATEGFNIAPVSREEKFQWCLGQSNNCPPICGGGTISNECEPSDLSYNCICSNGTVPDVSAYQDTIPFYICQRTYDQCIASHPNDAEGQDTCKKNRQCGTLNATMDGESSSESSASPSRTGSSDSISASGSASAVSSPTSAPTSAAIAISQRVATGALAAIFLATSQLLL